MLKAGARSASIPNVGPIFYSNCNIVAGDSLTLGTADVTAGEAVCVTTLLQTMKTSDKAGEKGKDDGDEEE